MSYSSDIEQLQAQTQAAEELLKKRGQKPPHVNDALTQAPDNEISSVVRGCVDHNIADLDTGELFAGLHDSRGKTKSNAAVFEAVLSEIFPKLGPAQRLARMKQEQADLRDERKVQAMWQGLAR